MELSECCCRKEEIGSGFQEVMPLRDAKTTGEVLPRSWAISGEGLPRSSRQNGEGLYSSCEEGRGSSGVESTNRSQKSLVLVAVIRLYIYCCCLLVKK